MKLFMKKLWLYLSVLGVIGLIPFEGNYVFFLFFPLMLLYNKKDREVMFGYVKQSFYIAFIFQIILISILQIFAYFNDSNAIFIYKIGFLLSVPVLIISLLISGIKSQKEYTK